MTDKYNILLYIALLISLVAYNFWGYLPKGVFYPLNSLFLACIVRYIYAKDKVNFIKFMLWELTIFNLIKETLILFHCSFVKPGELSLGEALLIVIIPFIWYLKNMKTHDKYNRVLERD